MYPSRLNACRLRCSACSIPVCLVLGVVCAILTSQATGQATKSLSAASPAASIQGIVRDSQGRTVAGAAVSLTTQSDVPPQTARTDAGGAYRFVALRRAEYTVHATVDKIEASVGPFTLQESETKTVDLVLPLTKIAAASAASAPEFYDEPQFTVAGVTDTTNLGGHGSDTVVRTRDALTKSVTSLSKTETGGTPKAPSSAEKIYRETLESDSSNFEANHSLGKLLLADGRSKDALPFLERASRLRPSDYDSAFELAVAQSDSGQLERANAGVKALLARRDLAELHHLLGDIAEKQNDPLVAVKEYERAAQQNPSEGNLFDWGAELLMHHAAEPAIEVFTKGHRLFPRSGRMLVGLGVGWYARGSYDQAAARLCEASDLNPADPNPYLFLGKIISVERAQPEGVGQRLQRFARLNPQNAWANYYYGLSLWKQRLGPQDAIVTRAEPLLNKAAELDPQLGLAYLQLGIIHWDRQEFSEATSFYKKAIAANPQLEEAHYRLAQAYKRAGDDSKAQQELHIYDQISKQKAEQIERERREVRQFVYTLRDRISAPPEQEKH